MNIYALMGLLLLVFSPFIGLVIILLRWYLREKRESKRIHTIVNETDIERFHRELDEAINNSTIEIVELCPKRKKP